MTDCKENSGMCRNYERHNPACPDYVEPEPKIETDMNAAIAYFKSKLPAWWYTSGDCFVSADSSMAPDPNAPDWKGPDIYALIAIDERFNSGFHRDVPHPYTTAQSLIDLTDIAYPVWVAALKELKFEC